MASDGADDGSDIGREIPKRGSPKTPFGYVVDSGGPTLHVIADYDEPEMEAACGDIRHQHGSRICKILHHEDGPEFVDRVRVCPDCATSREETEVIDEVAADVSAALPELVGEFDDAGRALLEAFGCIADPDRRTEQAAHYLREAADDLDPDGEEVSETDELLARIEDGFREVDDDGE